MDFITFSFFLILSTLSFILYLWYCARNCFASLSTFLDYSQAIQLNSFIEALKKVCPVGCKTHWKLFPLRRIGSPRCWRHKLPFPIMDADMSIYGSSVIVKGCAKVALSMVTDTSKWAEWGPSGQHLVTKPFKDLSFQKETGISSHIVTDSKSKLPLRPIMYRFSSVDAKNTGWVLFWSTYKLDWKFFLIQPVETYDFECCLLTHIRSDSYSFMDDNFMEQIVCKIQRIKDAVEMSYVQMMPLVESFNTHSTDEEEHIYNTNFRNRQNCHLVQRKHKFRKSSITSHGCKNLLIIPVSRVKSGSKLKDVKEFAVQIDEKNQPNNIKFKTLKTGHEKINCLKSKLKSTNSSPSLLKSQKCPDQTTAITSANQLKENISNYNTNVKDEKSFDKSFDDESRQHKFSVSDSYLVIQSDEKKIDGFSPHASPKTSKTSASTASFKEECTSANVVQESNNVKSQINLNINKHRRWKSAMPSYQTTELKNNNHQQIRLRSLSETNLPKVTAADSARNKISTALSRISKSEDLGHTNQLEKISSGNESESEDCGKTDASQPDTCTPCISDFEVLLPHIELSDTRIADMVTYGNYSASELQAQVLQASHLILHHDRIDDEKQQNNEWFFHSNYKGTAVIAKTSFSGTLKKLSYLSQNEIPVKPIDIWSIIRSPRFRFMYDETVKRVRILEEFSKEQKIVYVYHEVNGLLKKEHTDFCLLHTERQENSKYYLAFHSIEYANCPLMEVTTRGTLLPSGWVVENAPNSDDSCIVTYMMQEQELVQKYRYDGSVRNWIQGITMLPLVSMRQISDALSDIHEDALMRQTYKYSMVM